MKTYPTSIRLPDDVRDSIGERTTGKRRARSRVIVALLKKALKPDPVAIVVRECRTLKSVFYTAAWAGNDMLVDFADANTEAEIYEAIFDKIKRIGPVAVERRVEIISG